jgi:hypothetical protein
MIKAWRSFNTLRSSTNWVFGMMIKQFRRGTGAMGLETSLLNPE